MMHMYGRSCVGKAADAVDGTATLAALVVSNGWPCRCRCGRGCLRRATTAR